MVAIKTADNEKKTTNRNSTTTCKGDMYTAITKTSRVSIPYVFLFFASFINVDARSLVLKNDELGQQSQNKVCVNWTPCLCQNI